MQKFMPLMVTKMRESNGVRHVHKFWKNLNRWAAMPFIGLIFLYKWTLSPWLGRQCRFTPTCSQYGLQALRKYGLVRGLPLTIKRFFSCHPWGRHGYDPVP